MSKVIVYETAEGIHIVHPTPKALENKSIEQIAIRSVPYGLSFKIIDKSAIPSDRSNRDCWKLDGESVIECPVKKSAKESNALEAETRKSEILAKIGISEKDFKDLSGIISKG